MPDPSFIIEDVDAGGSVFGTIARPSVTEIEVPLIQTTGSGGGGVSDHPSLTARDEPDQHPISAIEDLQDALDTKALAGWPDVTLCPIDELTDATDVDDYNRTRTFVFGRSDDAEIHSAVQLANPGDVHTAHGAASVVVVEQAGAMPGSVFWRDPTGPILISAPSQLQSSGRILTTPEHPSSSPGNLMVTRSSPRSLTTTG
jgi:hypothetical protein